MRKIVVSIDHNVWDDFRIVKMVNKIGNCECNVNMVSGKKYINMKSIRNMMEFFEKDHRNKEISIRLEGEDEDKTAEWLMEYFES